MTPARSTSTTTTPRSLCGPPPTWGPKDLQDIKDRIASENKVPASSQGGGLGLKLSSFPMAKDDNVIDQMKKKSAMDEAMAATLAAMAHVPKPLAPVVRPALPLVFR